MFARPEELITGLDMSIMEHVENPEKHSKQPWCDDPLKGTVEAYSTTEKSGGSVQDFTPPQKN